MTSTNHHAQIAVSSPKPGSEAGEASGSSSVPEGATFITNLLAAAAILLAITVAGLVVVVHNDPSLHIEGGLPAIVFGVPVSLLLVGAFWLKRGSQLARIGLGFIFYLMSASFFFFIGFSIVVLHIPLVHHVISLAVAFLLSILGLSFFLSRRLKIELRDIVRSRSGAGGPGKAGPAAD